LYYKAKKQVNKMTQIMDDIRGLVECELGTEVQDSIWRYLESIGRVGEVETGREDIHWLANEIRKAQTAFGFREPGVGAPPVFPEDETLATEEYSPDTSRLRERAVALLLAREASKDPKVVAFRHEFLSGGTLPYGEVESWLNRQAAQDGRPREWLEVPVAPDPEGPIITSIENEDLAKRFGSRIHWRLAYEGEVPSRLAMRYIEYSNPNDPWRRIQPIAPGGVLERLWKLVRHLRFTYRPWSEGQATMFVLAGLTPQIKGVEKQVQFIPDIQACTRITLTIDPAVTPPELAEIYAKVRADVTTTRVRSLSDKHLRLAILCAQASDQDTWDQKMARWNETYPETEYSGYSYQDRRAFHRDAVQVCERLLHPPYQA
jgi:hypothetical protein